MEKQRYWNAKCDRSQSFRMPSTIGKYSIQNEGCKRDFPVVITYTANFRSMPVQKNPVVIIMCSTVFTFTDAIYLQLMLE